VNRQKACIAHFFRFRRLSLGLLAEVSTHEITFTQY
jgi:hypothetical protein